MAVSYKRLWKLLIDRDMIKKDLRKAAGISTSSLAKLGRDGNVTMDVVDRICQTLNCRIENVVEIIPNPVVDENDEN